MSSKELKEMRLSGEFGQEGNETERNRRKPTGTERETDGKGTRKIEKEEKWERRENGKNDERKRKRTKRKG